MSQDKKHEVGSRKWFQVEALSSLKKIENGFWDYSNSSVIYTPENSTVYEELQNDEGQTSYKQSVTSVEHSLIKRIAPKIVESLPDKFHYIDFGPGTEHKEEYFLDAIASQGKEVLYAPIDISKQMLDIADSYAKEKGFKTHAIHQTFEGVTEELNSLEPSFRFISLGLTFTNYQPSQILTILDKAAGGNGASFITVQNRDRVNIEAIKKVYTESVSRTMLQNKLRLIGLNPETDIESIEATDGVEVISTIKNTNSALSKLGVKSGDKLLLLRSYRYSLGELRSILKGYDVDYYDEDMEFVGCVIKH